jgi:ElaA protein
VFGPRTIKLANVSDCSVKRWVELTPDEVYSIAKLRTDVFLVEQKVDETELDGRDLEPTTVHYFIQDAAGTAAYCRTLENPQPEHLDARHFIGRVVVRADRRGEGLGLQVVEQAAAGLEGHAVVIHSQEYIAPLYAKLGFEAFGDVYVEAGIRHVSMYRAASTRAASTRASTRAASTQERA